MLYNKEKSNEQVTAAKTRRDTKDEQLKAYLKELGVGIGCLVSKIQLASPRMGRYMVKTTLVAGVRPGPSRQSVFYISNVTTCLR